MPQRITFDDLLAAEDAPPASDREGALRARAALFVSWATDDEYELDDVTERELLASAADHLISLGDLTGAADLADLMERYPDDGAFPAEFVRVEVAFLRGDHDAALAQIDVIRRARPSNASLAERVGELAEEHGHLDVAERWFTMGARWLEDDEDAAFTRMMLLTGRARVRRAAGKPLDALDEENEDLRAAYEDLLGEER
jgi:hypothetical protein